MIRSMTGYGRYQEKINDKDIIVEMKCVNHRYFDFTCRVPRSISFIEEKIRNLVSERIFRGKVEVYLTVDFGESSSPKVEINKPLLLNYMQLLSDMGTEYGLKNDVTVMSVARLPDIFNLKKAELDPDSLWEDIRPAVDHAVTDFIAMRDKEGEKMLLDLKSRSKAILEAVTQIETRTPEIENEYKERLETKIKEVLGNTDIDENRILTEVAIFADKIAVAEETVRLKSHFAQMNEILSSKGPIGRKLDFLLQEMNRETNTIGSKNSDVEIARLVVFIKSELEKIREQIQNIE